MALTLLMICSLLGNFLVFPTAHAEDFPQIQLHNGSALDELSTVKNWTLICEHLCSLNISGPACGPDCASVEPVSEYQDDSGLENVDTNNNEVELQSELCETLCDIGLGEGCNCPVKIVPAASVMPSPLEKNRICSDFCRFQHVTLRGCRRCPYDKLPRKPVKNSASTPSAPMPPLFASPIQPQRFDFGQETPFRTFDNAADGSVSAPPSTPDWTRICANLCRQGNGGILCNCDLAPF